MQSEQLAYLLYCRDKGLRNQLNGLITGASVERARSRRALKAPPTRTRAIVYGIAECVDADVKWLQSAFGLASPPCVVVAPLRVDCWRWLQPLRSPSLRIVWADEAEERLLAVLREVGRDGRDPMWNLGLRLLADYSFRPPVQKAISRVCGLENDSGGTPFVPANSVRQVSADVNLSGFDAEPLLEGGGPAGVQPEGIPELGRAPVGPPRTLAGQLERHRRSGGSATPYAGSQLRAAGRMHARRCGGGSGASHPSVPSVDRVGMEPHSLEEPVSPIRRVGRSERLSDAE